MTSPARWCEQPVRLSDEQVRAFQEIVGPENVDTDDYARAKYATGKTMEEAMKLRKGLVDNVADLVVHPRDKVDVQKIVDEMWDITGVQTASKPPSANAAGCNTFVGQTLIHWSHFTHFFRNSLSDTAPGGRIMLGEKFSSVALPLFRSNGKARNPAMPARTSRRLDRSGPEMT